CENNEYSMGTPLSRTLPQMDISAKAVGYGIPGGRFQGEDVRVVMDALREPVDRARRGEGPSLLECKTYRYRGHSMSDPGKYRSPEEVEEHKKRDPVRIGRQAALDASVPEADLAALDAEIEAEIADALKFADESAMPDEALMRDLVYAKN